MMTARHAWTPSFVGHGGPCAEMTDHLYANLQSETFCQWPGGHEHHEPSPCGKFGARSGKQMTSGQIFSMANSWTIARE